MTPTFRFNSICLMAGITFMSPQFMNHPVVSKHFLALTMLLVPIVAAQHTKCPNSDWLNYGQSCYYISKTNAGHFFEALQLCRSMKSQLLSIESNDEFNFLLPFLDPLKNYWIGLYRSLCILSEVNNSYWLDGSGMNYLKNVFDGANENTCCTRLAPRFNLWDRNCLAAIYPYICKLPLTIKPIQVALQKRFTKRTSNSSVQSIDVEDVVNNKWCSPSFCAIICLKNWMCAAFNLVPLHRAGCSCQLKGSESWMTFQEVQQNGASHWGVVNI
ncbi:hypothetical protein HELRODRAFT_180976 [Helobdella robusta]|uniref:C-type lectin domain-containing protein n=1 Tax=Helobdella robusta TaxID=6412 RepID=T1FGH3_HELRO|nr:hypothetical protein HELRODRAFT_180976 [Helobdella robusta]ESN93437.1 hypothetical protein HELRODRAFT_180976 [Helobdella robusta]